MRAVFERGIGCNRAVVLDGDGLVEAHLELPGLRAGDIRAVRLIEARGRRGVVDLDGAVAVEPLPAGGAAEGAVILIEVTREPVPRPDGVRAAKARPFVSPESRRPGLAPGPCFASEPDKAALSRVEPGTTEGDVVRPGPSLRERLAARGLVVADAPAHGPDLLEEAGWSDALEEARTGEVAFSGGRLLIERTAAFDVVDVDGHLPPAELALVAAAAVGAVVRRLDLSGNLVVDFPTPGGAAARRTADAALAASLPPDAERTAMNGFGLVQIVRSKARPSLMDRVQGDAVAVAALELLRRAERSRGAGLLTLAGAAALTTWLERRPELLAELQRRTGRPAALRADMGLAIWGGHVHG